MGVRAPVDVRVEDPVGVVFGVVLAIGLPPVGEVFPALQAVVYRIAEMIAALASGFMTYAPLRPGDT